MKPPQELIERIKVWCESEGMGMSALIDNEYGAIIFGKNEYSPDQVAVIVSHMLLDGVINGIWNAQNEKLKEEQKRTVN